MTEMRRNERWPENSIYYAIQLLKAGLRQLAEGRQQVRM